MTELRYCSNCVNISTRPTIKFDDRGLCPVCCHYEDRKIGAIDWRVRRQELDSLLEWGRERSRSSYDCIIGVSGGKDSLRQALYTRDELKAKPLLVSTVYPPEHLVERGARNLSNMVNHGFDIVTVSLNPEVWKTLMRRAFFKHGNYCKSTECALYAVTVHMAIAYHIPLILLGENPTYTIGETEGSGDGDATYMKYANTLGGGVISDDLLDPTIGKQDQFFYNYPSDEDILAASLQIVYLGYYIEDFNSVKNKQFAVKHGLELRNAPPEDTGEITHSQSLEEEFYIVNQMIKYMKFGYGQATDKLCEQVNLGLVDRETAMTLVRKYDGRCAERYIDHFCDYLDISTEKFWEVAESFRDKQLFDKNERGEWILKTN